MPRPTGCGILWFARPDGAGIGIYPTLLLLVAIGILFAISEVFHNAVLAAPAERVGLVSGLAYSLGNVGGLALMVFVRYAFSITRRQYLELRT